MQIRKLFKNSSTFEEHFRTEIKAIIRKQFGESRHVMSFGACTRLSFPFFVHLVLDLACGLQSASDTYRLHMLGGACLCSGPYWHFVIILIFAVSSIRLETRTQNEELAVVTGLTLILSTIGSLWFASWHLAMGEQYTGKIAILVASLVGVLLSRRASFSRFLHRLQE
jgi:hypothetical protein